MSITAERPTRRTISYPTSDGRPMAETETHRDLMVDHIDVLKRWFEDRDDVCVSGNMLMFYEEGNKHKHVSPDVFVVHGIPKRVRDNYLIWEEGRAPNVVFEFTSKSTRSEDTKTKMALYQDVLKVPEYFLFDPRGEYLKPRFQGYRLVDGEYVPIKLTKNGQMRSRQLGLVLVPAGDRLRFVDPATGRILPTTAESRKAESEARKAETKARRLAERETEKAREQVSQFQIEAQAALERKNAAERRAEAAIRDAESADARASAAEGELERVRQLLAKLTESGERSA